METELIYWVALIAMFVIGVIFGGLVVFFFRRMAITRQLRIAQRKAARTVTEARVEARDVLHEAREEADKTRAAAETEYRDRRSELQRQENRLASKMESVERRLEGLEQRERNLANKEKGIESARAELSEIRDRELKQLELVSGMSSNEAKQLLLERTEAEMQEETSRRLHEWEVKLKEEADKKAQEILSLAIQRCASEVVS